MLWCILFVHFVLRMLPLSLNLSIFLKIFSTLPNPFLWHFHEISFRTLCCLAPFELMRHPNYYCCVHNVLCAVLCPHVLHVPACPSCWGFVCSGSPGKYLLQLLWLCWVIMMFWLDMEGEEHSSSRPIAFGWLRVYIFIVWCCGGCGCIWCMYFFVCRRCCYYLEPVGHSLFLFWRRLCCVGMSWFVRHCCLMYRRRWWGCQSWPLFSPCVTFGSYLFSEEAPLRPSRLLSMTISCPTV